MFPVLRVARPARSRSTATGHVAWQLGAMWASFMPGEPEDRVLVTDRNDKPIIVNWPCPNGPITKPMEIWRKGKWQANNQCKCWEQCPAMEIPGLDINEMQRLAGYLAEDPYPYILFTNVGNAPAGSANCVTMSVLLFIAGLPKNRSLCPPRWVKSWPQVANIELGDPSSINNFLQRPEINNQIYHVWHVEKMCCDWADAWVQLNPHHTPSSGIPVYRGDHS